jgi:hypothetical protein
MYEAEIKILQINDFRIFLSKNFERMPDLKSFEFQVKSNDNVIPLPGLGRYHYDDFLIEYTEEGEPSGDGPAIYRRMKVYHEDREKLFEFVSKGITFSGDCEYGIRVHASNGKGYWDTRENIEAQPMENIFIPDEHKNMITDRVDAFIKAKEKYIKFGRCYKTGFLLTGIPGSGKTSFVKSIALKYKRPLYVLNFTKELTDGKINELIHYISDNAILLIEDLDSFFVERNALHEINISFSALINILDGVMSKSGGLLIFITANDPSKLDNAILRSGRIDTILTFDYPKQKEVKLAYEKIKGTLEGFDEFYENFVKGKKVPMASIVDYLFMNGIETMRTDSNKNSSLYI